MKTVMTWVNVNDKLPENENDILIDDGNVVKCGWWDGEDFLYKNRNGLTEFMEVKYWVPMPPAYNEVVVHAYYENLLLGPINKDNEGYDNDD